MESIDTPERNLEKDARLFLEAIKTTVINEIDFTDNAEVANTLLQAVSESNVLVLGEMHGVKENVDVIYSLFKQFGFRQLALEWESRLHQVALQYLETGTIDFASIQESPDGRITAGHFALLKKLQDEGLLEKLVCFDGSGELSWNQRDENMANNVVANLSGTPTLVVAGNLHTQTKPLDLDNDQEQSHPMGELLKQQIPELPAGTIEYRSGHYHNYGVKEFDDDFTALDSVPNLYRSEDGIYTFVVPQATAGIVPNPNEKL